MFQVIWSWTRKLDFIFSLFLSNQKRFAPLKYGTFNSAIGEKDPEEENFAFLNDKMDGFKKNRTNQHLSAQGNTEHVPVGDPATDVVNSVRSYAHVNRILCLDYDIDGNDFIDTANGEIDIPRSTSVDNIESSLRIKMIQKNVLN